MASLRCRRAPSTLPIAAVEMMVLGLLLRASPVYASSPPIGRIVAEAPGRQTLEDARAPSRPCFASALPFRGLGGGGFDFHLCGPHSRPPSERESSNSRAKTRTSTGSRGESEPARSGRGVRSAIALGGDARWRAPDVGYRHLAFACPTPFSSALAQKILARRPGPAGRRIGSKRIGAEVK